MSENTFIALILATLLAVPVTIIYLLFAVSRLKKRVALLESQAFPARQTTVEPRPEDPITSPPEPVKAPAPAAESTPWPGKPKSSDTPWVGLPEAREPREPLPPSLLATQLARLAGWLKENWFYAIAAASLALAGLFLVQYGIENGLLPPAARVAAALAFGAALIGGGEVIRRRFGDSDESTTAYLPSVLSGAGLVSLFGGIVSARMLYDLIAPVPALGLLFAIALGGLLLGWLHGPLLAAIGLLGGMAAPFLVGGESDAPQMLLPYFALLAALGLGIDSLRRWAWISVLAMVLAFGAGWLLLVGGSFSEAFAASLALYAAVLALLATLIPARGLTPDHDGPSLLEALVRKGKRPIFPAFLSFGSLAAACFVLFIMAGTDQTVTWLALLLLTGLGVLYALWSLKAPALQDHALLPTATLLAIFANPDQLYPLLRSLRAALKAAEEGQTEVGMPLVFTALLGLATLLSLTFAYRALKSRQNRLPWAAAAALTAPLAGLALELSETPARSIGDWPWALHALALAALMSLMAERFARQDARDKARIALPVLSALACLSFATAILLTSTALTLAIAATVLAAAALDRRFDLPLMGVYIAAGVVALGLRLTVEPGLDWATRTGFIDMLLAYGGSFAALLVALTLLTPMDRPKAKLFLDSAVWSFGGMTACLILYHLVKLADPTARPDTHWGHGLMATIWIGVALAQLQRATLGGWMTTVRLCLAGLFGLIAGGLLLLALTDRNPLFFAQTIHGLPLLNTLVPAYLAPALVLGLGARRLRDQPRLLRLILAALALALTVLWAFMAIRHLWQGNDAMRLSEGFSQPELYSYTLALLLTGAALFWQALARRSPLLRRAGLTVIGLAVAKVFLIDASGLAGLIRVFSFLGLGLALAALAWLDRWAQSRTRD